MNKTLCDEFAAQAERWDADTGLSLNWERRNDRRSSSIVAYDQPISFDDTDARARARSWATDVTVRMYDALHEPLRTHASHFRQGGTALTQVQETLDKSISTGDVSGLK